MIPQETVNAILDAAQIVDVVGEFVTLQRRGANYIACCPFHNEKTPSFNVSPARGIFKCFGCGEAGGPVQFLMKHENMTYAESLRFLANKYHIEIKEKEQTPEEIAARQRSESLYIVSDFASKFFQKALASTEGRSIGYQYFKSRGLTDETITKYGLGWAPKSKHALTDEAKQNGYKTEYLLETGLCAQHDDSAVRDRFYDRVIFPVHSVSGRVIAFGGRTLYADYKEKGIGKYVNSKESEIYVKSKSLYGIWFAKNEMAKRNKCYLVEGYLDVLSMHQLGITNVVASSGTSLTEEQIRIIKRFTNNVTIMYDGDAAGIHAAIRGIGMILKEGMDVKVVLIPDGDDPDSYSRKHTLEEVETFIAANEQDFINFKTDLLLADAGDDPLKKANLINDIADTIANIPDPVKRSVYVEYCSKRFNIDPQILFARIKATHEGIIADQMQAEKRAERLSSMPSAAQSASVVQHASAKPLVKDPLSQFEQVREVAPVERDIVGILLKYGSEPMAFETDSEYYRSDEPTSVADFIEGSLSGDNMELMNPVYNKVYNAYMDAYYSDAAPSQDEILRMLLNSPDEQIRMVSAQLSMDKYQLTVKAFEESLMTRSSWLVVNVPRTLLVNLERRLDYKLAQLNRQMADPEADVDAVLAEYQATIENRKLVRSRLGKERDN